MYSNLKLHGLFLSFVIVAPGWPYMKKKKPDERRQELEQTQQQHSATDRGSGHSRLCRGRTQRQSKSTNLIAGVVCSRLKRPSHQSTLTMLTPIRKALIIK